MNKKNLFISILFILIVFLSANSVFAGNPTDVTISFSDGTLDKNVTLSQTVKFNGTVKDLSGGNSVPTGDVIVYWWHNATQTWNLLNGSKVNSKCVYSSQNGVYSFDLNLKDNFLPKGISFLKVVFENSTNAFDSSQSRNLSVTVFSNPTIHVFQPTDAKVAVLQNYTVIVVDEDGSTPVAGINVTYTDIHGKKFIQATDAMGETTFQIKLERRVQQLIFTTPLMKVVNTYDWFLAASNYLTPYPVAKGDVNLTVAIDSPYGYVLGEKVLISWNISGPPNLDNKLIQILMYEDGKLQHKYLVAASDGNSSYTWKKSHKTLDIILVYPESTDYIGAQANVSTFIDENSSYRSTKLDITGLNRLKVGKEGTLLISVLDYMGLAVNNGQVVLKFDNYEPFTVDVIDGVANFTHAYQKAGTNRNLTITFLGEGSNKESSVNLKVNVSRGNGILTINMPLNAAFVGVPTNITVELRDLVIPSHKKIYAQLDFSEKGKLQHSITGILTSTGINTGVLNVEYTFIMPHSLLTILVWMNETTDYHVTSSKIETVIISGA